MTGIKQAVIVYKVRATDNAPLDIDDNPTMIGGVPTGRKQAIAILAGTENPNPLLYDVEFTFAPEGSVEGVPTVKFSDDCLTGYILASPDTVVLQTSAPTGTITIVSSENWALTSAPAGIATIDATAGISGETVVTLTRTNTLGQGYYVFTNTLTGQTAQVYVVNVDTVVWILEDGTWDNLGFWLNNGIWNY